MANAFDRPEFLLSEKDLRPYAETEKRAVLLPLAHSGYNQAPDYKTGKYDPSTAKWAIPALLGGDGWRTGADTINHTNPFSPTGPNLNPVSADFGAPGLKRGVTQNEIDSAATDLSGVAMTGGIVAPRPTNSVGMFGGIRAKTADKGALAKAQAAESAGVPREQIWKEHGWFKDARGQWAFEIPDAGFTAKMGQVGRLGDVVQHPGALAAYPELAGIKVGASVMPDATGSYLPKMDSPGLLARLTGKSQARIDTAPGANKSTMLHEMQHALDDIDGGLGIKNAANPYGAGAVNAASPSYNTPFERNAAAVAKRIDMSPHERLARPPWLDFEMKSPDLAKLEQHRVTAKSAASAQHGPPTMPVLPERVALEDALKNLQIFNDPKTGGMDKYGRSYVESMKGKYNTPEGTAVRKSVLDTSRMMTDPKWHMFADAADAYMEKAQRLGHNGGPDPSTWGDGGFMYANGRPAAGVSVAEQLGKQPRKLDPLGYYSKLDEVLQQFKPTDTVTRETLAQRGVKASELEARGLGNAFDNGGVKVGDLKPGEVPKVNEVRYDSGLSKKRDEIAREMFDTNYEQLRRDRNRAAVDAELNRLGNSWNEGAKHATLSLDKGSNPTYRESVVHLDPKQSGFDFVDGHWPDLKGTAFHIRHSMQKAPDGRLTYVPEEIQSGPGQKISGDMQNAYAQKRFGRPYDKLFDAEKPAVSADIAANRKSGAPMLGGVRDEAKIVGLKRQAADAKSSLDAAVVPLRDFLIKNDFVANAATEVPKADAAKLIDWYGYAGRRFPETVEHANKLLGDQARIRLLEAEIKTAEAATPGHPLVNTTDQWTTTAIRRAMQQAAEANAEGIAIPSGKTVMGYGMGGQEAGMAYAYDKMYPNTLGKELAKLDPYIKRVMQNLAGHEDKGPFSYFPLTEQAKAKIREGLPLFSNPAQAGTAAILAQMADTDRRKQEVKRPPHPNERPDTPLPKGGKSPFDDLFEQLRKKTNAFEDRK